MNIHFTPILHSLCVQPALNIINNNISNYMRCAYHIFFITFEKKNILLLILNEFQWNDFFCFIYTFSGQNVIWAVSQSSINRLWIYYLLSHIHGVQVIRNIEYQMHNPCLVNHPIQKCGWLYFDSICSHFLNFVKYAMVMPVLVDFMTAMNRILRIMNRNSNWMRKWLFLAPPTNYHNQR